MTARGQARRRLLNAYLRETGIHDVPLGVFTVPLPATGRRLTVRVRYRSPSGHHDYGEHTEPGHDELVAALLAELEASTGSAGAAELAAQVGNSVARTARYLARPRSAPPADPREATRHAEQSVRLGHPFHPTPKSAEGFTDADLARYAPELGARFVPHYLAVAREVVREVRVAPGPWVPEEVTARVPAGYEALPAHPWQVEYLLARAEVSRLVAQDGVRPLGPLGPAVYPTSSVRTVCDPAFPTSWKLPLHVRITNFVRTNPAEHLRRATDASALLSHLPSHPGFGVLAESGYRTLDGVSEPLAADVAVLYRQNPFAGNGQSPRVLAGLLDDQGALLLGLVAEAGDADEWLHRYLGLALRPLLSLFATHGVSFEAHVQNSLLCTEGGLPSRFWVRDMEGTAVSRTGAAAAHVERDSPLLYSEGEARLRLYYHVVTNHLGHLVHVLGRHGGAGEDRLWRLARECMAGWPEAADLLARPALPAKANLLSRFTGRGERPLYVDVPNPLREVP